MGDYPSRQAWTSLELTDQIFSSALQEATLQDEVYCQILKQLTHNTKRSAGSGEGWKAQQAQAPSAPRRGVPSPHLVKAAFVVTLGLAGGAVLGLLALGRAAPTLCRSSPGLSKPQCSPPQKGHDSTPSPSCEQEGFDGVDSRAVASSPVASGRSLLT